ncbi:response regulator transcription factor [Paenibacillus eucommiae]|uniref:DNA-binding response OmpR family regulator n=1 Tax=Paenibacillus eucommiae TaxID=1355755 RepID=A0ABS4JAW1_9BACL|nr:response regulator transcription factor [Paenibacillus eucommiae]MBP1996980.1 DNA-binding response OmpR family regulator [Paenibacillus eucommiae]
MEEVRVLIAEDEKEISDLLKKYLQRELYKVDVAADGEEALRLFGINSYSLVILDLMMPKMDGIEVCRRLRNKTNVPILMITAKDQEIEKILGLSIGADDYITKPFSINEVVARVKALIRRYLILGSDGQHVDEETKGKNETKLGFKGISIDLRAYTAHIAGEEITLTAKEFELLKFFMNHPDQVFTKTQLFRNVWDSSYIEDDNTVMVHIRKLRMKVEADPSNPKFIQTVWGIGYKFTGEKDES